MGFLDVLAKKGVIQSDKIALIEKESSSSETDVEDILIGMGVTPESIVSAKEEYFNLPSRKIDKEGISLKILEKIPESSAEHYKFVPIGIDEEGFLEVGLLDPDDMEARDALQFISSKNDLPFKLFIISKEDYEKVLGGYKGLHGEVTKALTELESEISGGKKIENLSKTNIKSETKIIEEAPVTKIVATILRYAAEGNASDIHIEHLGIKLEFVLELTVFYTQVWFFPRKFIVPLSLELKFFLI